MMEGCTGWELGFSMRSMYTFDILEFYCMADYLVGREIDDVDVRYRESTYDNWRDTEEFDQYSNYRTFTARTIEPMHLG